MARSNLWTREQLIMALNVYFKIPFKDVKEKHPLIQKYAPLIGTCFPRWDTHKEKTRLSKLAYLLFRP